MKQLDRISDICLIILLCLFCRQFGARATAAGLKRLTECIYGVNEIVSFEVAIASELFAASIIFAHIGFFIRMCSHMSL